MRNVENMDKVSFRALSKVPFSSHAYLQSS